MSLFKILKQTVSSRSLPDRGFASCAWETTHLNPLLKPMRTCLFKVCLIHTLFCYIIHGNYTLAENTEQNQNWEQIDSLGKKKNLWSVTIFKQMLLVCSCKIYHHSRAGLWLLVCNQPHLCQAFLTVGMLCEKRKK